MGPEADMDTSMSPLRVLLVEDSYSDAELILRHLRRANFAVQAKRVDYAEDFQKAIKTDPWDIVLCDYSLPVFSADEALALLRQSGKDIPFVVVSGNIGEESAVELLRAGAADYISKSNMARLAPAIQRELHEAGIRKERALAESDRLRLSTQLKQSQRRYKMLFDSFTDAVLVLKLDGRIIDANHTASERFALSREALLASDLGGLPGLRDPLFASPSFLDSICKDGHGTREMAFLRADGLELVFDVHFRVIEYDDLPVIIAVARDISSRKRMEGERARLYSELESHVAERTRDLEKSTAQLALAKTEAERSNRAKSQFLASMSHEIRTPLNAILGFSQILLRAPDLPAIHRESLSTIHRSGEHLLGLINDILEMSCIESGKVTLNFGTLDLPILAHDLGTMFRLRAEAKGINLSMEIAPGLPTAIVSDEKKLRQILINLLGNAVKFTEHGYIACRIRERSNGDERRLFIEVEDTGPGIDSEELPRLFEKFAQTTLGLRMGGTGLGLAICREFARLLGGDIEVTSARGKGSRFTLELPLIEGNTANLSPGQGPSQAIFLKEKHRPRTVLVVDDQSDSRKVLTTILDAAGFTTHEAGGAIEALARFDELLPHAVMMDMRMPTMHGIEVTQEIRKRPAGRSTIIIAVTASAFDEDRQRALDGGMNAFICKPFRATEVLETLGRSLRVDYVYMDRDLAITPPPLTLGQPIWSAELLSTIPPDLIHDLSEATVAAEYDKLLSLVDKLETHTPQAAREIRRLVHAFDYQTLLDQLEGERRHD